MMVMGSKIYFHVRLRGVFYAFAGFDTASRYFADSENTLKHEDI